MLPEALPVNTFGELPLKFELIAGMKDKGYWSPCDFQKGLFPKLLGPKSTVAVAPSGHGKTTSLIIAALNEISLEGPPFQAIILFPNREVTMRAFAESMTLMGRSEGRLPRESDSLSRAQFRAGRIFGGVSLAESMKKLIVEQPQILFATPGRLVDLVSRNSIQLKDLKILALCEFNELIGSGFSEILADLMQAIPADTRILVSTYSLHQPEVANFLDKRIPGYEKVIFPQRKYSENSAPEAAIFYELFDQRSASLQKAILRLVLEVLEFHPTRSIKIQVHTASQLFQIYLLLKSTVVVNAVIVPGDGIIVGTQNHDPSGFQDLLIRVWDYMKKSEPRIKSKAIAEIWMVEKQNQVQFLALKNNLDQRKPVIISSIFKLE